MHREVKNGPAASSYSEDSSQCSLLRLAARQGVDPRDIPGMLSENLSEKLVRVCTK